MSRVWSWFGRGQLGLHRKSKTTCPQGSKYPNMKYIPQAMLTIPNIETIDTPYSGTLDPWGVGVNLCWRSEHGPGCDPDPVQDLLQPRPPATLNVRISRRACAPFDIQ